jgi:hypothetical protein
LKGRWSAIPVPCVLQEVSCFSLGKTRGVVSTSMRYFDRYPLVWVAVGCLSAVGLASSWFLCLQYILHIFVPSLVISCYSFCWWYGDDIGLTGLSQFCWDPSSDLSCLWSTWGPRLKRHLKRKLPTSARPSVSTDMSSLGGQIWRNFHCKIIYIYIYNYVYKSKLAFNCVAFAIWFDLAPKFEMNSLLFVHCQNLSKYNPKLRVDVLQIEPETGPMKISSILTLISTKLAPVRPHYNSWQFKYIHLCF